jgi:ATP-dependent DNA helicase RecG
MALSVNIGDLLSAKKIESERIEFKEGWNPLKTMHTICAFANDFHNLGGGYIIVGAAEKNGVLQRPVKGIPEDQIDQIQKEIIEIGHKIVPFYHPIFEPYRIDEKWIVIIWVPGGQLRPYKALLK